MATRDRAPYTPWPKMPKKAEGEKMIVEFGVGILAICAAGYAVRRYRRRAKWTKIREEQLRKLKRLKRKFEEEK